MNLHSLWRLEHKHLARLFLIERIEDFKEEWKELMDIYSFILEEERYE